MKDKFWTSDKLLSLAALLVSLLTLVVFMYQTNLIRKQQYMSVYPHLTFSNYASGTLQYKYQLTNEGIGPAFIESINITSGDGKSYQDIVDYVDDVVLEEDSIIYFHSNLFLGRVIPEKDKALLIQLLDDKMIQELGLEGMDLPRNTVEGARKLYEILNNDSLSIELTYSSVYGETWTVTNDGGRPVKN